MFLLFSDSLQQLVYGWHDTTKLIIPFFFFFTDINDFQKIVDEKFPDDVEIVAKTVNHAVMSSNPYVTYMAGGGWWLYRTLQVLPLACHRWFLSMAFPSLEVVDPRQIRR